MEPTDDPEARIRELEQPLAEAARGSEGGASEAPSGYTYPSGPALPPTTPPPSFGSPSPWTSPRSTSRNRVWWILVGFFIIGTIAVPLGLAVFGLHRATHNGITILSPAPSISPSSPAPSGGGTQTPSAGAPTPSAAESTPPAGGNLTVSGINDNRTMMCNDNVVNVSGISNHIVIRGHCKSLNVSGVQNSITVDAVDTIEASGFNNQITYHTGSPTVDKSGEQNVVQQG